MAKYRCKICNYIYDEVEEKKAFKDLPEDWKCPVCNSPKEFFIEIKENHNEEKIVKKNIKNVSDVIVEQMVAWGVKYVFGIPGTSSLGIVESIRKNNEIQYFQVRHEQTAAMMSSAYGKLTGNVACCLTIAGPGATNLATGLYDAKLDKSPVLAITGHVKRELIGTKSFQEINQHDFFEPISVFNESITNSDDSSKLVTLAIKHAIIQKGVSHLSVSADIQKKECDCEIFDIEGRIATLSSSSPDSLIKKACKLIVNSKEPVIIGGFGVLERKDLVKELAEKISAPVASTFRGKGVLNDEDPMYVGCHGGIGSTSATTLVHESDLLIVIGSSYSNMTNIPAKPTIQIDIDPMMIGKTHPVNLALIGNSGEILPKILKNVDKIDRKEYRKKIANLKKEWYKLIDDEAHPNKTPIKAPYIMKELANQVDDDAIITLDVGENGWWFGRNFPMKDSQKMIMSGYLATMGFGLPSAMAAQIKYPKNQVVCITGDGGFTMVMGDFLTAVKYNLPIKVLLLNNHHLGMIMQEQKNEKYENWQTDLLNCDFAEFAKNCGGTGIKVLKPELLPIAIKKAFNTEGPVLIDIETDPKRFR